MITEEKKKEILALYRKTQEEEWIAGVNHDKLNTDETWSILFDYRERRRTIEKLLKSLEIDY